MIEEENGQEEDERETKLNDYNKGRKGKWDNEVEKRTNLTQQLCLEKKMGTRGKWCRKEI